MDTVFHIIEFHNIPEKEVLKKLAEGISKTTDHFGYGYSVKIDKDGILTEKNENGYDCKKATTYKIEVQYVDY